MAEGRVYVEFKCRACGHVKKRWFKPGYRIPAESREWCNECKDSRNFDLKAAEGTEEVKDAENRLG